MKRYILLLLIGMFPSFLVAQQDRFVEYLFNMVRQPCSNSEKDSISLMQHGWENHYCKLEWKDRIAYALKKNQEGTIIEFKLYGNRAGVSVPIFWISQSDEGLLKALSVQSDSTFNQISIIINDKGLPESLFIGKSDAIISSHDDLNNTPRYFAEWHDNGNIRYHKYPDSCNYVFRTYYANGSINTIGQLGCGMKYKGRYIELYESETIKITGNFKSEYSEDEKLSIRVGVWYYWTEGGCLYREENYTNSTITNYSCE